MKNEAPEIAILFHESSPYFRLRCDCGCRTFYVVQDGVMLKGNTQIMSLQCAECSEIQCFHPEYPDNWKEIN